MKYLTLCLFIFQLISCTAPAQFSLYEISKSVEYQVLNDRIKIFPSNYQYQKIGLIFYPGGFVSPEAYIPLLSGLAHQGTRVVIAQMPLGLAILDQEKALNLKKDYPEITDWVIAGHSLGGAMAAEVVKKHPNSFSGLILLAAYPAENTDLSNQTIPVLSVSASQDGLSTPAEIEASKNRLPKDAYFYQIAGGNHAQFGNYGKQNGDQKASIPKFRQQELTQYFISWFISERIHLN